MATEFEQMMTDCHEILAPAVSAACTVTLTSSSSPALNTATGVTVSAAGTPVVVKALRNELPMDDVSLGGMGGGGIKIVERRYSVEAAAVGFLPKPGDLLLDGAVTLPIESVARPAGGLAYVLTTRTQKKS